MNNKNEFFVADEADKLKDPVLAFCIIQRFCNLTCDDFIGNYHSFFSVESFIMWMYGAGHITGEQADGFLKKDYGDYSLNDVMHDEIIFPKMRGIGQMSSDKFYSAFADYISGVPKLREDLFNALIMHSEYHVGEDGIILWMKVDWDDMFIGNYMNKAYRQLSVAERYKFAKTNSFSYTDRVEYLHRKR